MLMERVMLGSVSAIRRASSAVLTTTLAYDDKIVDYIVVTFGTGSP